MASTSSTARLAFALILVGANVAGCSGEEPPARDDADASSGKDVPGETLPDLPSRSEDADAGAVDSADTKGALDASAAAVDASFGSLRLIAETRESPDAGTDAAGWIAAALASDGVDLYGLHREWPWIIELATGTARPFVKAPDDQLFYSLAGAIAADANGYIYVSGAENNPTVPLDVYRISLETGHSQRLWNRSSSSPPAPRQPQGLAVDPDGTVYLADTVAGVIRKIPVNGEATVLAGTPSSSAVCGTVGVFDPHRCSTGMPAVDGVGAAALFSWPASLTSDHAGHLYVADSNTVRQIDVATGHVTTLAGRAETPGSTDGIGEAARFQAITALAADGAGHVYIAVPEDGTIRKLVVATREVTTVIGSPGVHGVQLGPLPASLDAPTALAVLHTGELAIADRGVILGATVPGARGLPGQREEPQGGPRPDGGAEAGADGGIEVVVMPEAPTVLFGEEEPFSGYAAGVTPATVSWSLEPPTAGCTIDKDTGRFKAGTETARVYVVATSVADPTRFKRVPVNVVQCDRYCVHPLKQDAFPLHLLNSGAMVCNNPDSGLALCHDGQVTPLGVKGTFSAASPKDVLTGRAWTDCGFWTWKDGTRTDLTSPLGTCDNPSLSVNAVNDAGHVVGAHDNGSLSHAFWWNGSALIDLTPQLMPDAWPNGGGAWATDINAADEIVGVVTTKATTGGVEDTLMLWRGGTGTPLRTEAHLGRQLINDKTQIAGNYLSDGGLRAFLWQQGNFTDLGQGSLLRLTENGQILVGQYLWHDGQRTGPIPMVPRDMNEAGTVCGSVAGRETYRALLWSNGVVTDLNDVRGIPAGWTLTRCLGINERGDVVATAERPGEAGAFLLTAVAP